MIKFRAFPRSRYCGSLNFWEVQDFVTQGESDFAILTQKKMKLVNEDDEINKLCLNSEIVTKTAEWGNFQKIDREGTEIDTIMTWASTETFQNFYQHLSSSWLSGGSLYGFSKLPNVLSFYRYALHDGLTRLCGFDKVDWVCFDLSAKASRSTHICSVIDRFVMTTASFSSQPYSHLVSHL